mmetsp:Transcript_118275/g.339370  ORF Transcript_118275/g.339370 Transcript_118275/m.339370 type:complete len:900 (-) Transcript_118275:108-2807(-)
MDPPDKSADGHARGLCDNGFTVALSDGTCIQPSLVSGVIVEHRSAFAAKSTRLFTPCGAGVLCHSVRTGKHLGVIMPAAGRVTAISAGPSSSMCAEPLAIGAKGQVSLWDSKSGTCLSRIRMDGPIAALRWITSGTILVVCGTVAGPAEVEQLDVSSLDAPRMAGLLPLTVEHAGPFDATADASAICDGNDLVVCRSEWGRSKKHAHKDTLTAVSIDPAGRFVATGDVRGVVWLWWGIIDEREMAGGMQCVPGRWHWHAHPVRCLVHCGPLLLSGGDEGVLCVRNVDDETTSFVPRFPAPLSHMAASTNGQQLCISLNDNSLALVDGLHGWVKPRYIHALDVPVYSTDHKGSRGKAPAAILHALADGSLATSCGGRRVQFLDERGNVMSGRSVNLNRGNTTMKASDPMQRWQLRHAAFSSKASWLLTCESRRNPALERFDIEGASQSRILKWWFRGGDEQYAIDCVATDPHSADITMAVPHPYDETIFATASLDGSFKCWCRPAVGAASPGLWCCTAIGNWRSRPVLSGCFSADGSIIALGFHGFAVLWDHKSMTELRTLTAGEGADRVLQLSSVALGGRFLLIANVCGIVRQEVVCWDLVRLEALATIDLVAAFGGRGRCCMRVEARLGLRLLAYKAGGSEIRVWRFTSTKSPTNGTVSFFEEEVCAKLPSCSYVLDVAFMSRALAGGNGGVGKVDGSRACRLACWTSDYELWDINLSGTETPLKTRDPDSSGPTAGTCAIVAERQDHLSVATAAGRLINAVVDPEASCSLNTPGVLQLVDFPVRTTLEQQAGFVPRFVQKIVPSHVPSHMLPPPPAIFESLLDVFARRSGSSGAPSNDSNNVASRESQATILVRPSVALVGRLGDDSDLLEAAPSLSELADPLWMDTLVGQVVAARV